MGLATFATLTYGDSVENPRFFPAEEKALARAQRKHQLALDAHKARHAEVTARVTQSQPNLDEQGIWQQVRQDTEEQVTWNYRRKRPKVVARVYERARWKREDFAHQKSRRIVNEFDVVAIEDLSVKNMVQNGHLAKSIHDAAWSQFADLIACKAAWADRRYVAVNPAHTSQDCSGCGNRRTNLTLTDRVYHCHSCGLIMDRDLNAAWNILRVGLHSLGLALEAPAFRHGE